MTEVMGETKPVFYFKVCGEINTDKTLELGIQRAEELSINKIVIASETGLSAVKASEKLRKSDIKLIVVTSAAGTKIENTIIGDLRIGLPDSDIRQALENSAAQIVRATDPFYNIGAALEHRGMPTLTTFIRRVLGVVSSGTAVGISVVLMATDNGVVSDGEEVVALAGSWVGLDTAVVMRATNSVNFFKPGAVEIREIICKPRNPTYSWPINQKDWRGNLEPYKKFSI